MMNDEMMNREAKAPSRYRDYDVDPFETVLGLRVVRP